NAFGGVGEVRLHILQAVDAVCTCLRRCGREEKRKEVKGREKNVFGGLDALSAPYSIFTD
ncbi:hypothetical protein M5Z44_11935, partial [Neisseria meningitidis]|nr:hypothetical protein [Neisseria meningitidis]